MILFLAAITPMDWALCPPYFRRMALQQQFGRCAVAPPARMKRCLPRRARSGVGGYALRVGLVSALASVNVVSAQDDDEKLELRSATSRKLSPKRVVLDRDSVRVAIGAAAKIHVVPWVDAGSSINDGDVAEEAGFAIDDALLGASAELWRDLEFLVSAQLVESDRDVRGVVGDVQLVYQPFEALAMTLGTMVPPFSRSALAYAQNLPTVERPYVVDHLRPDRRLGAMLDGRPWGGRLTYMVAIMNGTPGYVDGNEDGGFMAGGRLEAAVFGDPDPSDQGDPGLSVAVSGYHSANTVDPRTRLSADVLLVVDRFSLVVEVLHQIDRGDAPHQPTSGAYAELGSAFDLAADYRLQIIARGEVLDRRASDGGEDGVVLFTGGINLELLDALLRAQLQVTRRQDREDGGNARHGAVLSVRALF